MKDEIDDHNFGTEVIIMKHQNWLSNGDSKIMKDI